MVVEQLRAFAKSSEHCSFSGAAVRRKQRVEARIASAAALIGRINRPLYVGVPGASTGLLNILAKERAEQFKLISDEEPGHGTFSPFRRRLRLHLTAW